MDISDYANECSIEIWPQHPPGGQHVTPSPSGIKVTHLPTGITACVESARSQHSNKMIAMDMILAALTHPRFNP